MSERTKKVNELVGQVVADTLNHEIESSGIVTVKAVETSPDLRYATVWVSILGDEEEDVLAKIEEKRRGLQRVLNSKMSSKHVPVLNFKVDYSGEYAQKIEELLKNGVTKG